MPFFDEEKGTLVFDSGLCLSPRMPLKELARVKGAQGAGAGEGGKPAIVALPAQQAMGGRFAPLCLVEGGQLRAVTLTVLSIGQRTRPTADQQRAFLFGCVAAKDPCPDSRRNCEIRCGFGTLLLTTDPRLGQAWLRVEYQKA